VVPGGEGVGGGGGGMVTCGVFFLLGAFFFVVGGLGVWGWAGVGVNYVFPLPWHLGVVGFGGFFLSFFFIFPVFCGFFFFFLYLYFFFCFFFFTGFSLLLLGYTVLFPVGGALGIPPFVGLLLLSVFFYLPFPLVAYVTFHTLFCYFLELLGGIHLSCETFFKFPNPPTWYANILPLSC